MSSDVALAIALYSLSVDDLAMVGCFLASQEIKDVPRYIAKPEVDQRSSMSPPQSLSV